MDTNQTLHDLDVEQAFQDLNKQLLEFNEFRKKFDERISERHKKFDERVAKHNQTMAELHKDIAKSHAEIESMQDDMLNKLDQLGF